MPKEAASPVPTMTAVGVARPRAQGHAMTRVEIPKSNANWNFEYCWFYLYTFADPPFAYTIENQKIQVIAARKMIIGTKMDEILSATPYIGALVFYVFSTSLNNWL